jgi:hypothetical protein
MESAATGRAGSQHRPLVLSLHLCFYLHRVRVTSNLPLMWYQPVNVASHVSLFVLCIKIPAILVPSRVCTRLWVCAELLLTIGSRGTPCTDEWMSMVTRSSCPAANTQMLVNDVWPLASLRLWLSLVLPVRDASLLCAEPVTAFGSASTPSLCLDTLEISFTLCSLQEHPPSGPPIASSCANYQAY